MYSLVVFCCVLVLAAPVYPADDKVKITVFFETICKDSRKFMVEQLHPLYSQLQDRVVLDLNAFGKSNYTGDGTGCTAFECNHGPAECESNMMVTCAKQVIPQEQQFMDFVKCIMQTFTGGAAGRSCARETGLCINHLSKCIRSEEGQELHRQEGLLTDNMVEDIPYVPRIYINGEYSEESEFDLKTVVCKAFVGPLPAYCLM